MASAGKAKYYFLVPNLVMRQIKLGDIITDPYNPHNVLIAADQGRSLPSVDSIVLTDYTLDMAKQDGLKPQRQLFGALGGSLGVGADISNVTMLQYRIGVLETIFCDSLSTEDIGLRIQDHRVRSTMKGGIFRRNKPVYIVTGVKVAKDLEVATSGSEAGQLKKAEIREKFRIPEKVVIAYQLKKIELPRGKEKDLKINNFTSSAAFM